MEFLAFSQIKNFFIMWIGFFFYCFALVFLDTDYKIIHVYCKEKLEATDNYLEAKTPQVDSLGR